jgi:hypothetical protein
MKPVKECAVFFSGSLLALFIAAIAGHSQKPSDQMAQMRGMSVTTTDPSGNPCDVMASMAGMKVMGESMAAMTNHMCITPMRPKQPGDEGKAKAAVAQVRAIIEKYKDYKKALADGYVQANPTVDQPQFHSTATPTRNWRIPNSIRLAPLRCCTFKPRPKNSDWKA